MSDVYGEKTGQTIIGTSFADNIYANGFDLTVKAGAGNDYIVGGHQVDYTPYYGNNDHDLLYGEAGDDTIVIYEAGQRPDPWSLADGGAGNDTAVVHFDGFGSPLFYTHNSVSADVHCGRLAARLVSIEQIIFWGGAKDDQIAGGNGNDQIFGENGADKIDGSGGNDILWGGDGTDIVTGGAGSDGVLFDSSGNDKLDGGSGNDTLDFYSVWNGAGVTVDLRKAGVQTIDGRSVTIAGFENVFGTDYADTLTLTDTAGTLYALDGNDILIGGKGADTLVGGAGDDLYYVDNAKDRVVETLSLTDLSDAGGKDQVRSSVSYALSADSGARFVEGLLLLGSANITGTGNELSNRITGNAGNNTLSGAGGPDRLLGYAGADTLQGGAGNDWLQGGVGRDTMTGGAGADRFVFDDPDFAAASQAGSERITDFSHLDKDRIDLSSIDAKLGGSDDPFTFIGKNAFSHVAGELRAFTSGTDIIVQGDTNGDAQADFWIALSNAPSLIKGDFLL